MIGDPRQRQLSLFFEAPSKRPPTPGGYDFDREIRALLSAALRRSEKNRAAIAVEMTILIHGKGADEITKVMLDRWCAHDGPRFPMAFLPAFIQAVDDPRIIDEYAKLMGYRALNREQARLAEYGALELQKRDAAARQKELGGSLSVTLLGERR